MKKSLILKFVVLAMLCYVAILPTAAEAACERSECVTFDDGSPGCAYYGGSGYRSGCYMESWEIPPGSGDWVNFCKTTSCW